MDFGSLFNSIGGGIKNFFTGGGQANQALGGFNLPNMGNQLMGGFGKLFGNNPSGGNPGGNYQSQNQIPQGSNYNPFTGKQIMGGGLNSQQPGFNMKQFGTGLAGLFGANMIPNPGMPKMPDSFNQFQKQAQAGGPPIMQQGNQYLSTLLSGQNTAANDAATHSLDLNYQEQLRQLNGMYKSLRPGTDPTSDTTYQRDLSNLNDQYTRQRAQTLAQQQIGAAGQAGQMGQEQASQQQSAIEAQLNQIAEQWNMSYEQRSQLRNMLMQQAGLQMSGPLLSQLFSQFRGQ